jgi:hypothetical protein
LYTLVEVCAMALVKPIKSITEAVTKKFAMIDFFIFGEFVFVKKY